MAGQFAVNGRISFTTWTIVINDLLEWTVVKDKHYFKSQELTVGFRFHLDRDSFVYATAQGSYKYNIPKLFCCWGFYDYTYDLTFPNVKFFSLLGYNTQTLDLGVEMQLLFSGAECKQYTTLQFLALWFWTRRNIHVLALCDYFHLCPELFTTTLLHLSLIPENNWRPCDLRKSPCNLQCLLICTYLWHSQIKVICSQKFWFRQFLQI